MLARYAPATAARLRAAGAGGAATHARDPEPTPSHRVHNEAVIARNCPGMEGAKRIGSGANPVGMGTTEADRATRPGGEVPSPDGSHGDDGLERLVVGGALRAADGRRLVRGAVGRIGDGLGLLGVLLLRAAAQHLERGDHHLGLPMPLAGIVIPLARLEAPLDIDELALRQELATDLGQAVPGDARVVLGALAASAAKLVGRDREGRQRRSFANDGSLLTQNRISTQVHLFGK
jgi:hypothetical protein